MRFLTAGLDGKMRMGAYIGLTLLLCLCAGNAQAQTLQVRSAEHDGYSRLVFDWGQGFSYKLKKSGDNLQLSFNIPAKEYNFTGIKATQSNLLSVTKTQDSPLSVSVALNEGAKYRDLKAGTKLILDVYTPKGGKSKPQTQKTETSAATPQPTPTKEQEEHSTPPPQEQLHSASNAKHNAAQKQALKTLEHKTDGAIKVVHKPEPETKPATQISTLEKASAILDTNLITVSATRGLSMAVFEEDGTLWMVTGQKDLFIRPQAAGANEDQLKKIKKTKIEQGQLFKVKLPGIARIQASGTGLLWRIKLSNPDLPETDTHEPALLERIAHYGAHGTEQSLKWHLPGAKAVLDVPDPLTGGMLKVVTVDNARIHAGPIRSFVEFDVLHSSAGLAIRPKIDDLIVEKTPGGITISAPGGLNILPEEVVASVIPRGENPQNNILPDEAELATEDHIYKFRQWEKAAAASLEKNRTAILATLPDLQEGQQIEKLIALGKMHLASGYAHESLGFFNMAGDMMPELYDNPQFVAMIGAAKAMAWKSEEAFNALMTPALDYYVDAGYWRAYALADLGDWNQAAEQLPDDIEPIFEYPAMIRNRLSLGLAEVFLRDGNVTKAEELLDLVAASGKDLDLHQQSALKYLRGEAARQRGEIDTTRKLWGELIDGDDDLFRAKAGLAHTRLQIDEKKLDAEAAVDTLERLRYSWRGDELEMQVNYWLGRTYFEGDNFLKGLLIMRESASMAPTPEYGREVLDEMEAVFTNFYIGDKLKSVSALDALTLYEQFSEILPNGERGTKVIDRLARYLSDNNMYGRAADLFTYMIQYRLDDSGAVNTGLDLAALYMLDDKPDKVLKTLSKVEEKLATLPAEFPKEQAAFKLLKLRIKALSDMGKADQALELIEQLERTPEVNKLRADVAWDAEYWDEAADALSDVILDQQITMTRPLTDEQTRLILNRAIALNLDSDRIAIANMREKYSIMMDQTDKARIFEVITRPRQNVRLADRETLMANISEVDLFQDFIESYRKDLINGGDKPDDDVEF